MVAWNGGAGRRPEEDRRRAPAVAIGDAGYSGKGKVGGATQRDEGEDVEVVGRRGEAVALPLSSPGEAGEEVGVDLTPVATAPREQREKETGVWGGVGGAG